MRSREALRVLAEVTESQWGMITSAQSRARGVSHMNLTRLTESGDLIRLAHGVYRDAGTPSAEHEELRAAWLAIDPARLAYERLSDRPMYAVVSGESAARLHGIGDLRAMKSEFTTRTRKQTQRTDLRYRIRVLPDKDVTVREGLPVTTRERTIADLVEDRQDRSIVGDALRDAASQSRLDIDRLTELLGPLAERNGYSNGDGESLLDELLQIAGIDVDALAKQVVANAELGALVVAKYLENIPKIGITPMAAALGTFAKYVEANFPKGTYQKQLEQMVLTMSDTLSKVTMPDATAVGEKLASSVLSTAHSRLDQQLKVVDWVKLAAATQKPDAKAVES